MRQLPQNTIVVIFVLFVLFFSCNNEGIDIVPEAKLTVLPSSGVTTDTFIFDASYTDPGRADDKTYYRWDWNSDGIWDEEYSRIPVVQHRFYTSGIHSTMMKVINSSGLFDTAVVEIMVEQGYSPPRAEFEISPSEGNFKTEFTFDASVTEDDEDSLEFLQFRWDFSNDGFWDIGFNSSPIAKHVYPDTGQYSILLEVKDPSKRIASKKANIHITDINPLLVADFEWIPKYGTTLDSFKFNASLSHHKDDPDVYLQYSWKFPPEYEWSEWTGDPIKYHRFGREVVYPIELRIKDVNSLVAYRKMEIQIYHENLPPDPKFIVGHYKGNIRTQFYFDSWTTVDLESLPTTLMVRWDFNGDGTYDTDFSYDRIAYQQYSSAGRYKVIMEAVDPEGLSDTISHYIDVSPWENETGLIRDHRDGQYYGTVKIGDQWWMSENLNFRPPDWHKDYIQKWCYSRYDGDPIRWCEIYGGLYNVYHATRNDWYGDVEGICPKGWHIPSRQEWEELINYIGGNNQSKKLLTGGETDFNALFGGYGYLKPNPDGGTSIAFKWRNYATYFWSFTRGGGGGVPLSASSWNVALIKDQDRIYEGYSGNTMYYYVRCIRNDK